MNGGYFCQEKSIFPSSKLVENCKRYSFFSDNHIICSSCNEGYYLQLSSNSCKSIETCPGVIQIARLNSSYDEVLVFEDIFSVCDETLSNTSCGVEISSNGILFNLSLNYKTLNLLLSVRNAHQGILLSCLSIVLKTIIVFLNI